MYDSGGCEEDKISDDMTTLYRVMHLYLSSSP